MKNRIPFTVFVLLLAAGFQTQIFAETGSASQQSSSSSSVQVNRQTKSPATVSGYSNTTGDPLQDLENVSKNFNKVVQETMRRMRNYQQTGKAFEPDADFVEYPDRYVLKIDLPGMQKEQINIETSKDAITISGERKTERTVGTPNQEGVYQYERSSGSFYRRMSLPANANTNAINAKYENGVLEVSIPKLNITSPEVKKVKVQ